MSLLSSFLTALAGAIRDRDGRRLRDLLDVDLLNAKEAVFEKTRGRGSWDPSFDVSVALRSLYDAEHHWQDILTPHLRALDCLTQGRGEEAFAHLDAIVLPFTKEYREDRDGWLAEPMIVIAQNMRAVALASEVDSRRSGNKSAALESCGSSLQRIFATAILGSDPRKKAPVLEIVVTLFRVYFRLNTLRLCKNLMAAVDRLDFSIFPASARVSYKFFVGRLCIFDEQYEAAEEALEYALRHCHRGAVRNKARILYFLVPVKMLLGQLPSQAALRKYGLEEYSDIVEAMRSGSVRQFTECLEAQQWHFIEAGTHLVLEKLEQAVLRRLLKRVIQLHAGRSPDKASQLPLGLYQEALAWQGMKMEIDEVECVVANLVYRGYVKGYVSNLKKVLVLSKAAPFPHLKTVRHEDLF